MTKYIYQHKNWTHFSWNGSAINALFGEVRHLQGRLTGQMNALGFAAKAEATLSALSQDVVQSSAIEGEHLDYAQVRSSIARRLGMDVGGLVPADRYVEGVVEMMLDATQNYLKPLSEERLFSWHAALFPTGFSGMHKIEVGRYRTGEMQVVSGALGKEHIHYEAPSPQDVKVEMNKFLQWFNATSGAGAATPEATTAMQPEHLDPVMKAAIAHFWFIIIHPFDDGNGRIARAVTDMLLARAEGNKERYYSLSSQIMAERKQYYKVLQKVQHSSGDITDWLEWFLHCLKNALLATENTLNNVLHKATFWDIHETTPLNERQRLMLNKLLDGFEGKLQSSKWAKIAKCSTDTALRDIKDLMEKGILRQEQQGGRSTHYELVAF